MGPGSLPTGCPTSRSADSTGWLEGPLLQAAALRELHLHRPLCPPHLHRGCHWAPNQAQNKEALGKKEKHFRKGVIQPLGGPATSLEGAPGSGGSYCQLHFTRVVFFKLHKKESNQPWELLMAPIPDLFFLNIT